MEFETVLRKRISVRKYTSEVPSEEKTGKIVEAALLGPVVSRHHLHLSVIRNKEIMKNAERNADAFFHRNEPGSYLYDAPVWIVLSGRKYREDDAETNQMWNNNLYWNIGSLIENMHLQAAAEGLAACAVNSVIVAMQNSPEVRKAAGIPEGYDALASIVIGFAAKETEEREVNREKIPAVYID